MQSCLVRVGSTRGPPRLNTCAFLTPLSLFSLVCRTSSRAFCDAVEPDVNEERKETEHSARGTEKGREKEERVAGRDRGEQGEEKGCEREAGGSSGCTCPDRTMKKPTSAYVIFAAVFGPADLPLPALLQARSWSCRHALMAPRLVRDNRFVASLPCLGLHDPIRQFSRMMCVMSGAGSWRPALCPSLP